MNGVLLSRKESFYTSALEKDCHSTDFLTFNQSLNATGILDLIAPNETVDYCDYYEVGVGY